MGSGRTSRTAKQSVRRTRDVTKLDFGMWLRTGIVVAVSATGATGLFGAGVVVGNALHDSDRPVASANQVELNAPAPTRPSVERDKSRGRPPSNTHRQAGTSIIPSPVPIGERLNRALLIARQTYLDQAAVTRYQKALKNDVAYGFCKAGSSGRYRCTVVELMPQVDPRKQKKECLLLAMNRRQRRACAKAPDLSRSQSTVDFDVSLQPNGCWVAVRPGKIDPTGSAKLQGCLSPR